MYFTDFYSNIVSFRVLFFSISSELNTVSEWGTKTVSIIFSILLTKAFKLYNLHAWNNMCSRSVYFRSINRWMDAKRKKNLNFNEYVMCCTEWFCTFCDTLPRCFLSLTSCGNIRLPHSQWMQSEALFLQLVYIKKWNSRVTEWVCVYDGIELKIWKKGSKKHC